MRIYPSKHKIKSIPTSKMDTTLNIPLAYIDIDYTKYNISKMIEPGFSKSVKTILCPEQEFENLDFLLFNEREEIVDKKNLFKFQNNKYYFSPATTTKFSPKQFLWKATVKKNLDYNISNTYNLKIRCEEEDEELNRNIISTFMNPSERNMLVYSNIKINSNDKSHNAFTRMSEEDADFLFIKSHNAIHYDIDGDKLIDYDNILRKHTNIWIGCEDAVALNTSYNLLVATESHEFRIANPIISTSGSIFTNRYFDLSLISTPTNVTVHNIFTSSLVPALILEYDKLGFVIITSYDVLDDPLAHEGFMYELMMYVYMNTYSSTDYIKEWITYKLPNYEIYNGAYSTKSSFVSKHSISSMLKLTGSYTLVGMEVQDNESSNRTLLTGDDLEDTTGAIKCIGQNNGKPIFVIDGTLSGYVEPDKPEGWKSVYYNDYIYYVDKLYYLIEEDITNKVLLLESENNLIVKVYNFKSSKYNINKQADSTLQISFIKTDGELTQRIKEAEYTIYYEIESKKINFCYMEDYKESDNQIKLFNVLVEQTSDAIEVFDMRQLGGGLSEDEEDDFELMDIGHINGRPYRIAGTLVLTMPTKYKPYEEQIKKVINKYKTAEDYIAIFFEDEESDDN